MLKNILNIYSFTKVHNNYYYLYFNNYKLVIMNNNINEAKEYIDISIRKHLGYANQYKIIEFFTIHLIQLKDELSYYKQLNILIIYLMNKYMKSYLRKIKYSTIYE